MIYDAAKVGSMSIYYRAYSGSSQLIDTMSLRDFGNTLVDYTPMYDKTRVGYFNISRVDDIRWFSPMEAAIDLLDFAQVGIYRRFCPRRQLFTRWILSELIVLWVLPIKAVIDSLKFIRVGGIRWCLSKMAAIDFLDFAHVARLRFYCYGTNSGVYFLRLCTNLCFAPSLGDQLLGGSTSVEPRTTTR